MTPCLFLIFQPIRHLHNIGFQIRTKWRFLYWKPYIDHSCKVSFLSI